MFNNKNILLTGGTGSFGNKFVELVLQRYKPKKLIIFSRDEMKQWEMARRFPSNNILRFFIGDVRDKERLYRALAGVDLVVHAAATKIVPTAEYNPFETIKTNVNGAMNLIDTCIDSKVKKVIALSTDKASSPSNLYGATKLASDKLFVAANNLTGKQNTLFSVVRYGNVVGSRGSVVPVFKNLINKKNYFLPITHLEMTRFWITLSEGVQFVINSFGLMRGGEIFVPKIPSVKIIDVAKAMGPNLRRKIVVIRSGEKLHELLFSKEESLKVLEHKNYYEILPSIKFFNLSNKKYKKKNMKKNKPFEYSSDKNKFLSINQIKKINKIIGF